MHQVVVADKRLLVTEIEVSGRGPLVLRRPVLIEPGQRYWVEREDGVLVVEGPDGKRSDFPGDFFGPRAAGMRPFTATICEPTSDRVVERSVEVLADSYEAAQASREAQYGLGTVRSLTDVIASRRRR